jgi:hypothetical protein
MADFLLLGDVLKTFPRLVCIYDLLSEGLRKLFGSHHSDTIKGKPD